MNNEEKAREIANQVFRDYEDGDSTDECYTSAIKMAEWKDKQCSELINLLLDSIDHAYLQTNGTYGDLALEVADKVEYLKTLRYGRKD